MLYFWITNAVKKSRTPPGSVSGPGFFFGGPIAGAEKQGPILQNSTSAENVFRKKYLPQYL
jgi:hypothetical protein